jgi:hypothetical protein
VCTCIAAGYGWGRHTYYVSPYSHVQAFKAILAVEVIYLLAIALARISIAVSLLPLSNWKVWRLTLWAQIMIQTVLYIGWMVVILGQCRPISSIWEPVGTISNVKCWDAKYEYVFGWVSACTSPDLLSGRNK